MAPITDCMKKGEVNWTSAATRAFEQIKRKMTEGPVLHLPNFEKLLEVACDASNVRTGGVLSQEGHPISFYNEKLSNSKKFSTCDPKFYSMVQVLQH